LDRLTKPNSKYLDAKNHKLQQYENTGHSPFAFENLVESLRKDLRQSQKSHESTKKLFRELEAELEQYKRALELACGQLSLNMHGNKNSTIPMAIGFIEQAKAGE